MSPFNPNPPTTIGAKSTGMVTAALGSLVLIGWAADISWIKSVIPGAVEMKANTAIGLVLAGGALWLLATQSSVRQRSLGMILAFVVGIGGLATGGEYLFGWQLGIDELLFRDTANAYNVIPGRMSPYSTVAFACMGLGLVTLPRHSLRWLARAMAVLTLLIGSVSALGYLWNASELVTDNFVPPVAVNTAVAFILLGWGLLSATRDHGIATDTTLPSVFTAEGKTLAGFMLAVVLLFLAAAYAYRAFAHAAESALWVSRTLEVRGALAELYADISDAESGQRTYLLSSDPPHHSDYLEYTAQAERRIAFVEGLIIDNPAQLQSLRDLRIVIDRRMAALARTAELFEQSGIEAARINLDHGTGSMRMGDIRAGIRAMDLVEAGLLVGREADSAADRTKVLISLGLMLGLGTGGFTLLFTGIRRELHARAEAERSLRRSEENLAVTLNAIGDGMLAVDERQRITRLNPVAERLTGWNLDEAMGRPVDEVFRIVHQVTREPAANPIKLVLSTGEAHNLARDTVLIARDGTELPIADQAAPIRGRNDQIVGGVLIFRDISDEQASQQALRESEAQLRDLFDGTNDLIQSVAADGSIEFANRAWHEALGYAPAEIAGLNIFDIIHPECREHCGEIFGRIMTGERVGLVDVVFQAKDGRSVPVEGHISVRFEGGKPMSTRGIFRDVTKRHEADISLRVAKERLDRALEASGTCTWESDLVANTITLDSRWAAMLGKEAKVSVSSLRHLLSDTHPADCRLVLDSVRAVIEDRSDTYAIEHRYRHADGTWIWILSRGRVMARNAAGRATRIFGTNTDITARKQIQEDLNQFKSTLDRTQDCVFIFEPTALRFIYANQGAIKQVGYTAEELRRMTPFDIKPEFDETRFRTMIQPLVANEQPSLTFQTIHRHKSGTDVPVEIVLQYMAPAGEPARFIAMVRDITERRKAEKEIRQLNLGLEEKVLARTTEIRQALATLDAINDAALATDPASQNFVYVNQGAVHQLGYSREELLGMSPMDINPDLDLAKMEGMLRACRTGGGHVLNFTARHRHKDGHLIPVELNLQVVTLDDGKQRFIAIARDITERQRVAQTLVDNEARLRFLNEIGEVSRLLTDPDAIIAEVTAGIGRHLHASRCVYADVREDGEHVTIHQDFTDGCVSTAGTYQLSLFGPRTVAELRQGGMLVIRDVDAELSPEEGADMFNAIGIKALICCSFVNQDGLRAMMAVHQTIPRDWKPEEISLVQEVVDRCWATIERARAQQSLAASERFSRASLDALASHIAVLDGDGRIVATNLAWRNFGVKNGLTLEQINQTTDYLGVCERAAAAGDRGAAVIATLIREVIAGKRTEGDFEYSCHSPREERWFLCRVTRFPGNGPVRVALAHENITAIKQAEAAIRTLNADLERRVQQRTAELSAANHQLDKASRLKDEFLANMSHELRTPLNAILGLSEALLEQADETFTPRQIRSVATISASGHHLLSLINDILDLSKIEAGKLELNLDPIELAEFCESCLVFVRTQAMHKRISIAFELKESTSRIVADPKRLKQILVNLLTNAVKFTPEGGKIGLVVNVAADEEIVRFAVWDTGIGIAAELQPKLFHAFTQLDSGLTRAQEGTGLGLALVAKLVELHGGSVQLESEPEQGSRFTVTLPASAGLAQREEARATARATLVPVEAKAFRRALIIEDDPSASDQIERYLAELSITSILHTQGDTSVDLVLRERPDFIVLDLLLPNENGWVVLARLKQHPDTRDIPVVIISVVDEPQKSLMLGAAAHFTKPVTRAELANFLQRDPVEVTGSAPPFPTPTTRGPVILLAEDNEANIQTLGDYLDDKDYSMHYARNGLLAVQLARELQPDLILMDIQMPVMDGLTAIREIQADANLRHIPIVALTALAMPADRQRCLAAGAVDYLSKPVGLKALAEIIAKLTSQT